MAQPRTGESEQVTIVIGLRGKPVMVLPNGVRIPLRGYRQRGRKDVMLTVPRGTRIERDKAQPDTKA
jgi:hypothetical protein